MSEKEIEGVITFKINDKAILKFTEDGNIYYKDRLITNDKEILDGLREFLLNSKELPKQIVH